MDFNDTEFRPGNAGYAPLPPYVLDEEFKIWYGRRENKDEIWFLQDEGVTNVSL